MSLQERIEKAKEEAARQEFHKSRKEYERIALYLVATVYKSGDYKKIEKFTKKLDYLQKYVETKLEITQLPRKEIIEKRNKGKDALVKILEKYQPDQTFSFNEIAEKTGLNRFQLVGYTRGKNPLLVKEGEFYKAGKTLKKK